jgi:hypothetical protein
MTFDGFSGKVWTIHGTGEDSGVVLKKDAQFSIQPVTVNGAVAYYSLQSTGGLDPALLTTNFYPLGWKSVSGHTPLIPWKEDTTTADTYQAEADRVANSALKDPLVQRLEGTFTYHTEKYPIIARIHYFKDGEQGPKDWLVFDIITAHRNREDGTAHADG